MSLAINVDDVAAVLLADGWHPVKFTESDGGEISTFALDAYEFIDDRLPFAAHGGGNSGICPTGFMFRHGADGHMMAGPLSAILAVRIRD